MAEVIAGDQGSDEGWRTADQQARGMARMIDIGHDGDALIRAHTPPGTATTAVV